MFRSACRFFIISSVLIFSIIFINQIGNSADGPPPLKFDSTAEDIIYYVPQFSDFQEISIHEMRFLKETLRDAKEHNVKAVIFEIDTPGGQIDVALKYVSILAKAEVPTIAFVNPQGISAGMIVALAADRVAINPNGTIGDAMPMQLSQQGYRPVTDKPDKKEEKPKIAEKTKAGKSPAEKKTEAAKDKKEDQGDSEKKDKTKVDDEKKKKQEAEKKKQQENDDRHKKTQDQIEGLRKLIKNFDKLKNKKELTPEEKKLADQKFLTVFFKVLQVLAEKNNRPVKVVRAMADPYQKLSEKEDGIEHTKVSPLTLSAVEAKRLKVVDYICRSKTALKNELGLKNCKIVTKNKTPTHYIIFFLAHPLVSGLLIVIGLIGLYIEAKTPGFGFAGGLGLVALALFFFGHVGIGDSNWVPTLIFLIGIILLALEIFVIPGFGITGISGIIAIFASLLLAFGWDNIELAINTVGISMIVAVILIIFLTIYVLPKSTVFKKITLDTSHSNKAGFSSHEKPDKSLVGLEGIVHTTLRPTGLAIIDDQRLDVITEGDFIEKGEKIKVQKVEGMRIIVDKA